MYNITICLSICVNKTQTRTTRWPDYILYDLWTYFCKVILNFIFEEGTDYYVNVYAPIFSMFYADD